MKLSSQNLFSLKNLMAMTQLLILALSSHATLGQEPEPDTKELVIGAPIERKLSRLEAHMYTIELKLGEVVRVSVKEKGADVSAAFIRVSDEQKASAISNAGTGFILFDAWLVCVLVASGEGDAMSFLSSAVVVDFVHVRHNDITWSRAAADTYRVQAHEAVTRNRFQSFLM